MEAQSSQAHVDLVYHGPDVDAGSMEVRDLAPAMLALASLIEATATEANGDRARIKISLTSTSTGSFHLGLEILNTVGVQGAIDTVYSASDLTKILFGSVGGLAGTGGVWGLIKWLKGRQPSAVQHRGDNLNITINAETINIPNTVYNLSEKPEVRKSVEDVTHIVNRVGIDAVEIQQGGEVVQRVDKSNVEDFSYDGTSQIINRETSRRVFTIVNLAFRENNKWRVSDGTTNYMALVTDNAFLARVNRNEIAFSKSGQLVCQFQTVQVRTSYGKIKTEYRIIAVERYIPADQLHLPMGPV